MNYREQLRAMKSLLDLQRGWDFFINLSGQDIPLKSDYVIRRRLAGQVHRKGDSVIFMPCSPGSMAAKVATLIV